MIKRFFQLIGKLLTMSVPKEKSVLVQGKHTPYYTDQTPPQKSVLAERVDFVGNT